MPKFRGRKPRPKADSSSLYSSPSTAPQVLSEVDVETWLEEPQWASVSSSNVNSIMYDAENQRLYVAFSSGGSGYYDSVDDYTAAELFGANSMGKFVYFKLRPHYTWIRI